MSSNATDLELVTRPRLGQLLGLAWPIVISRSAQVVVGVTDAVMVARLGEAALGATMAAGMNAFALLILPMGTVFIVSSFASQLFGKGDLAGARRYGFYGLVVALATELLCLAAIPLVGRAVGAFDYAPDVSALMTDYLVYRLLSGGAVVGLEALGNFYGALKNTALPMAAQITAMVLHIPINWVLIFGHLGAPALGVRGAALASSISTIVAFAGLLGCFLAGVGMPEGARVRTRLVGRELWRMLRVGLPSGLNWFFEFAAFIVFVNVVVAGLGTSVLSAMMAVFQINSVSFMPAFGLATAGSIFVGQAIGAKRHDDAARTVRLTLVATSGWQGLVGVLYLAIPGLLIAPFAEGDAVRFVAAGVLVLRLSAAWQLFDAAANTLAEALRAAGDTTFTSIARGLLAWGVFAPGAYVSVRVLGGGEAVATLWFVAYLGLLALVLAWRYRSGKWRSLELVEPTASSEAASLVSIERE